MFQPRIGCPIQYRSWLLIYSTLIDVSSTKKNCIAASFVDGHRFDVDPDTTFHFDADQDSERGPSEWRRINVLYECEMNVRIL